jgi:hypothetical protein
MITKNMTRQAYRIAKTWDATFTYSIAGGLFYLCVIEFLNNY